MQEFKTTWEKKRDRDGRFNRIIVRYYFGLQKTTKDVRSKKPFKIIKKEYIVNTWMSLVGAIGGTLGMFVGFSIIDTSEFLITAVSKRVNNYIKS